VSVTFPSRRSSMPLHRRQAAPALNSRRPGIPLIKALCSSRNGRRNCSSCMPPLRVLPPNSHQTFIGESRGPRDTWRLSRLRASIQFINASMPVDGGCLAQPYPVQFASNCVIETVSSRALRPRYAADLSSWHSAGHLTCRLLMPPWTNVWSLQARRF